MDRMSKIVKKFFIIIFILLLCVGKGKAQTSEDPLRIRQFEDGYIYTMGTHKPVYSYSLMRGDGIKHIKGNDLLHFLIDYNTSYNLTNDEFKILYNKYNGKDNFVNENYFEILTP